MTVTNKQRYNNKHGFKKNESHSKKDISKKTGIPVKILDKVYYRGVGARKSNPQSVRSLSGKKVGGSSLAGKMSGPQWGFSRIYSFIMKQPGTWKIADEVKKLRIKGYMR